MPHPLLQALALPPQTAVDLRIPRKELLAQPGLTAAERKLVTAGLEELTWVASLKPANVGVPPYADETCDYSEIAVLLARLKPGAKVAPLARFVQRAVPYPAVLVTVGETGGELWLAIKRRSGKKEGGLVLDALFGSGPLQLASGALPQDGLESQFLASLALDRQPQEDLSALYSGWLVCLTDLQLARRGLPYSLSSTLKAGEARRAALDECARLEKAMAALRSRGAREKQLNRRVALNLELRALQVQHAAELAKLKGAAP